MVSPECFSRGAGTQFCFGVNPNACKRVARRVKQPVVYILASKPCVDGFTKQRHKKWNRAWKIRLIEEMNPEWKDLSEQAF